MQKLYASVPVQYKSWCTTNIWYLNLTYITNVTQIYYICKYNFHFASRKVVMDWKYGEESEMTYSMPKVHGLIQTVHLTVIWMHLRLRGKQFVPDSNRFDRWSKPSTLKNTHIATGMAPSWRYFKPCAPCATSSECGIISGKKQLKTAPYKSYHKNVYWLVWCFSYLQWLSNN